MFEKALVPLDGTKSAESILSFIAPLAKTLSLSLVLFSSVRGDGGAASMAEEYLDKFVKQLEKDGLQTQAVVTEGQPEEGILAAADQHECDLIAIATHGDDGAGNGVLGSTTVKVLQTSSVPILLLAPERAAHYTAHGVKAPQIIVPMDGSTFGETALPYAEDLARRLSAPLALVHSVRAASTAVWADPTMGMVPPQATVLSMKEETEGYLNDLCAKLGSEGLKAEAVLLDGPPAQQIVDYAEKQPQSLIVMTSHGHGALARWLLGSVTEAVTRTANDAVLVIPRQFGKRQTAEITELLGQVFVFSGLSQAELQHIARAARIRTYPAGSAIVTEGETSGGFYIISDGNVEVLKGEKVVDSMRAGDFFGEMSILENHPRSATIKAVTSVECVTLHRSDFMEELKRFPEIAVNMLPELGRRLREAREMNAQMDV